MTDDKFWDDFMDDSADWPPKETSPQQVEREQFPCTQCGGNGKWRGGINQHGESKCFACKGKGFFLSSAGDRAKARQKRAENKITKLVAAQMAFNEQHPTLIGDLKGMVGWNNFAASLVEQFNTKGSLSENQTNAAYKMIAKCAETKARKAKEREAAAVEVDLSTIKDMFNHAVGKGHKRPKYRAEGLIISRAPDHGRNAGSLYVKTIESDQYQGKITAENKFYAVGSADAATGESLKLIAADPSAAAMRYGQRTGSCGVCGRELTNSESIDRGIGPICADNMGI
jgi:hypothetical protein